MYDYTKHVQNVCAITYYVLSIVSIWFCESFHSQAKEEFCKIVQLYQDYTKGKKPESVLKKACARFIYLAMCPRLCKEGHSSAMFEKSFYYQSHSFPNSLELKTLYGLAFYKVSATTKSKYNVYVSYIKNDTCYCKNLCDFPGTLGFRIIMALYYPEITKIYKWD